MEGVLSGAAVGEKRCRSAYGGYLNWDRTGVESNQVKSRLTIGPLPFNVLCILRPRLDYYQFFLHCCST